jgi:choline kinase
VRLVTSAPLQQALILAAGNGDRFKNTTGKSKLLQIVLGQPLIVRTLETAWEAGITAFEIVIGYQADAVRRVVEEHAPAGAALHFTYNPQWHLENGVSAMAARARLTQRFALLMGDHLFDPSVLARAMAARVNDGESLLAIDSRQAEPAIAAEATKVRLDGGYIVAIGKDLERFDALDTGLFVCDPNLFDALETAGATGDTTLSAGIRLLAARRLMRGFDIGDARWYDIDTPADLESAEALLAPEPVVGH